MEDNRQYEEEDKEASKEFIEDEDIENQKEPDFEPECTASEETREQIDVECEFVNRDGSWWCNTHNCWA